MKEAQEISKCLKIPTKHNSHIKNLYEQREKQAEDIMIKEAVDKIRQKYFDKLEKRRQIALLKHKRQIEKLDQASKQVQDDELGKANIEVDAEGDKSKSFI